MSRKSPDIPAAVLLKSEYRKHRVIAEAIYAQSMTTHNVVLGASDATMLAFADGIRDTATAVYGVKSNTGQALIFSALRENGMNEQRTYDALRPHLGQGGLIFSSGGKRAGTRLPMLYSDLEQGWNLWRVTGGSQGMDPDRVTETMPMRLAKYIREYHRDYVRKFGGPMPTGAISIVIEPEALPAIGAQTTHIEPTHTPHVHAEPASGEPMPINTSTGCGGCDNGECCQNGPIGGRCGCCGEPIISFDPVTIADPEPSPSEPSPSAGATIAEIIAQRFRDYGAALESARMFADSRPLRSLNSMRLNIDARALIAAGLPWEGILSNVVCSWGKDSQLQAGIEPYDWAHWCKNLPAAQRAGDFQHEMSPAIMAAIVAGVPVWLWGGAGIGKSVAAELAAAALDVELFEVNMSGMGLTILAGKDTINPKRAYVESLYIRAYRDGGVFLAEEIDATHPKLLTFINNSISNGYLVHPDTGERIPMSEKFRIVATANTNGTGSANGFIREKVDAASTDRFSAGMFEMSLDRRLESNIVGAKEENYLSAIEAGDSVPLGFVA